MTKRTTTFIPYPNDGRCKVICDNEPENDMVSWYNGLTLDEIRHNGSINGCASGYTELHFTIDRTDLTALHYNYVDGTLKPDMFEHHGNLLLTRLISEYEKLSVLPAGKTPSKQASLIGELMVGYSTYNTNPQWLIDSTTPYIDWRFEAGKQHLPENVEAYVNYQNGAGVPAVGKGSLIDNILTMIDRLHPNFDSSVVDEVVLENRRDLNLLIDERNKLLDASSDVQKISIQHSTTMKLMMGERTILEYYQELGRFCKEATKENHTYTLHYTTSKGVAKTANLVLNNIIDDLARCNENIMNGHLVPFNANIFRNLLQYAFEEILLDDEGHILKALLIAYHPTLTTAQLNAFVDQYVPKLDVDSATK